MFLLATVKSKKTHLKTENILGVNINSNNVSITVLKQLCLGQNIWRTKAKILTRRSKLQSLADRGSCRARGKLRLLRQRLRNFTRNSTGGIAKQIHEIALKYNASIVMEKLVKFTNKSKTANRKISPIPFRLIQERIAIRSVDNSIPLGYVDPYYTSKWCPRCGSVNPPHSKENYAILNVNSDRKANLAIAVLCSRFPQEKCL